MRVLHGDLHSWNVKVTGGRVVAFDFEDLMWGWPVQDIATTLYYWWGRDDFQLLRSAFRQGYETVAPWPDATGDEVDTFIVGRALVIANDAIQLVDSLAPGEAEAILRRGQERIRLHLDRTG
jgi:Ser/Thr protein kinase RdoA (MazF antagonist)